MTTFTISVDEATAASFQAAAAERDLPVEELIVGMAAWTLAEQDLMSREPFTPEQIAEIDEALAQIEKGEGLTNEEVFAGLRGRFPAETGRQIIERALESYSELLSHSPEEARLHQDWDAEVARGLEAMRRGDETPQDQVFAEWRARYG